MTKSKHMMIAAVAGMLTLLMAFAASAGPRKGRARAEGFGKRMAAALELTTEQKTQIHQLKVEMKKELQPTTAKLKQLRAELRVLWSAGTADENAITAKNKQIETYRAVVRERRVEFRLDVLDLLTPEQQAKLKQMKAKRQGRERRGGRHGAAKRAR